MSGNRKAAQTRRGFISDKARKHVNTPESLYEMKHRHRMELAEAYSRDKAEDKEMAQLADQMTRSGEMEPSAEELNELHCEARRAEASVLRQKALPKVNPNWVVQLGDGRWMAAEKTRNGWSVPHTEDRWRIHKSDGIAPDMVGTHCFGLHDMRIAIDGEGLIPPRKTYLQALADTVLLSSEARYWAE